MNNNAELIAAGHELAKSLDNEPLLDIAKMIVRLADKLEVTTAALREKTKQCEQMAAENSFLMNGAARELSIAWLLHKTMLGTQAALLCIKRGDIKSALDWLEGTTDEAPAELPDEITVDGLEDWFNSQMISSGGKNGFLTRDEAEKAIRAETPATDAFLREVRAQGVEMLAEHLSGLRINVSETSFREFSSQLRQGGAV
ncbi:hypothetical protein PO816_000269 [Cronobacter dublinensis]|nr:hypothetical protein [Cronobacter dublinensis]